MLSITSPDEHSPDFARPDEMRPRFAVLLLGCIGVVYGDIGTSPLYAFREAALQVAGQDGLLVSEIYGILSLILWALLIIVTLKYVLFLLHIDNRGEGGILSLMSLVQKAVGRGPGPVLALGLIGAALFYGDAAITPAISVMSAVEGLKLVTPAFEHFVLPISLLILIILFIAQKKGTGKVALLFGPVTTIWFLTMAAAGIAGMLKHPDILLSLNPYYAFHFLFSHGMLSLIVLGAVFLAVTGAEALYADLGHFGLKPIQCAWLFLVFPCLMLNYLGQGALVLSSPEAIENPFFLLVPDWALLPMVGLATMATIIASQAVISGAYSLTRQAIQLGLLPRMEIRHTSNEQHGQIYIPRINLILLLAVLFLCVLFGSSSALASAYGIAVTGTMVVTTIFIFFVLWKVWKKNVVFAACVTFPIFLIECIFLGSNFLKLFAGGYVPLVMAGFLILFMTVWVNGTRYLRKRENRHNISLSDLIEKLDRNPPLRIEGTAIFLTSTPQIAPTPLLQNLRHNRVLHQKNIILTVVTSELPRVPQEQRIVIDPLSSSMTRIVLYFGYMETPDIPKALQLCGRHGFNLDLKAASYFLGKRTIVSDPRRGLPEWQDRIYISMSRSAIAATDFYHIPINQVVEMGVQMAV